MEICKHDEFCGGCIYQGIPYAEQLKIKEDEVLRLLAEKEIACKDILPIEPSPSQYRYRNKMEYTFGDMEKGGEMSLGMHRKKHFMSIITVDQCQLVHEDFNRILRATLDFCQSKGYSFYHKRAHKGLLRHLIVRRGERTGEILVNLVTSTEEGFDEEGYTAVLRQLPLENRLVGVLRTFNDRLADAVYCEELKTLWGRDYYMERIMGLDFKVSAFSFFQTNVEAVEHLYTYATGLIDDFSGKVVFDLFCGTGTITQTLARSAKRVVGVELVEEAVQAAKANAALNGLDNCEFIAGDVFEVLETVTEKPDVIVVDPPRVGISAKALDKIISYGVEQIVYVSCNPKTLAENLSYMQEHGYKVECLKAFDNFAGTKHVETVALLSKLDVDQHIDVKIEMDELDITAAESKATYEEIKEYILGKFKFKVSTLYIAQIKRKCGIDLRDHYNISKKENHKVPQCPPEKEEAILDALKHFQMI